MTTLNDVQAIGREVEKIVNQLIQAEKSTNNAVKNTKDSLSGGGGGSKNGNPKANFGGAKGPSGMAPATFSGISGQVKESLDKYSAMGGNDRTGKASLGLGIAAAGVGALWGAVPGVNDAYKYKQQIFNTAYADTGSFNHDKTFGKIKAGFGSGMDSTAVDAASRMTNAGIGPTSNRFQQTMNQAGMLSAFSGRSNSETTAGMISMQQGSQGVVGNLASYGIFVTDPRSGKSGGLRSLVDQLWGRWFGSSTARIDSVQFEAELMGGQVGADMQTLFGATPELYWDVMDGLRIKQKAGGKSVNMNVNKNGKNSANAAVRNKGVKTEDQPWGTRQKLEQGRMENIADSSDALIKGFQDAAVAIDTFNDFMNKLINSGAGQLVMRGKGGIDTLFGSELGGVMNGLGTIGMFGLGQMMGGGGLLKGGVSAVKSVFSGGTKAAGAATSASGASSAVSTAAKAGKFAKFGGPVGAAVGAALATIPLAMSTKDGYDSGGWRGAGQNYFSHISQETSGPMGVLTAGPFADVTSKISGAISGMFGAGQGSSTSAVFGQGLGADLPHSPSEAIGWAAESRSMTGQFKGLCDNYVAKVYGLAHSGYTTARAHWQGIPDRYKHPGDRNPPVGALVFWNNGNAGHVAVVVSHGPDGPIVSTTHVGGTPTQMSLEECTRQLGGWGIYYGWSQPYFGGNTAEVGGPASAAAAETASSIESTNYIQPTTTSRVALGDEKAMTSGLNTGGMLGGRSPIMGGGTPSDVAPGSEANSTSTGASATGTSTVASLNVGASSLEGITPGKSPPLAWDQSPLPDKSLISVLQGAGFTGEDLREAYAISKRESSGNPSSHNPRTETGDYSYGLFQINMLGSLGPERDAKFKKYVSGYNGPDSLFDANVNARAAAYMSQKGRNWSSWNGVTGRATEYYAKYPGASAGMYLSQDQLVNAHAGEMIVPAAQTTQLKEMLQNGIDAWKKQSNVIIHVHVKNASREEAEKFAKWIKQDLQHESVIDKMRSQ